VVEWVGDNIGVALGGSVTVAAVLGVTVAKGAGVVAEGRITGEVGEKVGARNSVGVAVTGPIYTTGVVGVGVGG